MASTQQVPGQSETPREDIFLSQRTLISRPPQEKSYVKPGRIVSLDVFRGMTIAAMILVNNSGGPSYGPLDHAEWNGWTHTDLIFPFFMFIAGASMALSFATRKNPFPVSRFPFPENQKQNQRQERQEQTQGPSHPASGVVGDPGPSSQQNAPQDDSGGVGARRKLLWHVVRRGATIFFIGLWLNLFPWFFDANRYANLRIPGVLQRIGFCYVFTGIIYLWTRGSSQLSAVGYQLKQIPRFAPNDNSESHNGPKIRAAVIAVLLLGYWAAMKLAPVPGYGAGDLAPTHNLAAHVDNLIFGTAHMWQHRAWDPEGLLSSVPALCTMLIGTFVGEMFVKRSSSQPSALSSQQTSYQLSQNQKQVPRDARNDNPVSAGKRTLQDDSAHGAAAAAEHPLVMEIRLGLREHEHDPFAVSGMTGPGAEPPVAEEIQSTWQYKVGRLVSVGIMFMIAGEVWNRWFPINKNLWTSSYVMFSAGYAMVALAAVYYLVDVRGCSASPRMSRLIRSGAAPFLVFGSNAILAFTLSTFVTKLLLVLRVPNGQGGSMSMWSWAILHSWRPHFADVRNSSLAFALSYVLIWLAVMTWFYRKRVFVKI